MNQTRETLTRIFFIAMREKDPCVEESPPDGFDMQLNADLTQEIVEVPKIMIADVIVDLDTPFLKRPKKRHNRFDDHWYGSWILEICVEQVSQDDDFPNSVVGLDAGFQVPDHIRIMLGRATKMQI